jgi:hypothetical protein
MSAIPVGTMGQFFGAGSEALAEKLSAPTRRLDDLSPPVAIGKRCGVWTDVGCVDCDGCFGKFFWGEVRWLGHSYCPTIRSPVWIKL